MDIKELFKSKNLSEASIKIYSDKLKILNDGKKIRSLNFLNKVNDIMNKLKKYKPNSQRTFIIAITSALKCQLDINPNNKKIKKRYDDYSKILKNYNNDLRDQTMITENENNNWISMDDIKEIYKELTLKKDKSLNDNRNYLILSLYHLIPPRRNKDYQLLKITSKYNNDLSNEFNYLDIKKKKFIFNNYKTAKKYNTQETEINEELFQIINSYIKIMKLKEGDFLLNDLKTNEPFKHTNAITILLNRIFKKKIGASMLRKLYLTHKYGEQAQELKEDMKAMGSSVDVANNNYIKKK